MTVQSFLTRSSEIRNALILYDEAIQSFTYELDGKQDFIVNSLALNRFIILEEILKRNGIILPFPLHYIPGIFVITKMLSFFTNYIPENFSLPFTQNLEKISKYSQPFSEKVSFLIDMAYLTSCVAFLILGFYSSAIIGFTSIALTQIKKRSLLPYFIDKSLSIGEDILSMMVFITKMQKINLTLFFKLLGLYENYKNYLTPKSFSSLMPKDHIFEGIKAPINLKNLADNECFVTILSHIFSKDFTILPEVLESDLMEMADLLSKVEERIRTSNITFDKKGYDRIKKALIKGSLRDSCPSDMNLFTKIMKEMLFSIYQEKDSDNFSSKIRELAEVGNSCVTGWTRDISFLLNPKVKDIKWAVFYQLSTARDAFIKEALNLAMKIDANENESNQKIKAQFKNLIGGEENVHFFENIAISLWPIFRSNRAELYRQQHGFSLYESLCLYFIRHYKAGREFFMRCFGGLLLPFALSSMVNKPSKKDSFYGRYFNVSFLVDYIYTKIKPVYSKDTVSREWTVNREISWDAVTAWFSSIKERGIINLLREDGSYNPRWVEQGDQFRDLCLTKEAVRLLLWDLGVIKPKKKALPDSQ